MLLRRRYMGGGGGVPFEEQYFTFEALEAGTFTLGVSADYSLDGGRTWTTLAANTATPTIQAGDKILWRRTGTRVNSTFTATGDFNVYGNSMSLLYGDDFATKVSFSLSAVFQTLFKNNANLISAENLILPATTLTQSCYYSMFYNCTNLTTAPELPATSLASMCYRDMFRGCTSLTTAPELLSTTLGTYCYSGMFYGCSNLTSAHDLPAITLEDNCYNSMFYQCTSLTSAPEIYATTLADSCCQAMFYQCTSLISAQSILKATTLADKCYYQMFAGCSLLEIAPELPATTLVSNCYYQMFNLCNALRYTKCLATDISATGCVSNWLNQVSSTGTFVKNASMNNWPSGASGIPNNWTVENATS